MIQEHISRKQRYVFSDEQPRGECSRNSFISSGDSVIPRWNQVSIQPYRVYATKAAAYASFFGYSGFGPQISMMTFFNRQISPRPRGISKEVLDGFTYRGLVYESSGYHNAVFVGMGKSGTPRHAHKHSTAAWGGFKGNIPAVNRNTASTGQAGTIPVIYYAASPELAESQLYCCLRCVEQSTVADAGGTIPTSGRSISAWITIKQAGWLQTELKCKCIDHKILVPSHKD